MIDLVREVLKSWPGNWEDKSDPRAVHEAKLLMLSTTKAKRILHWKPAWNFEEAISHTIAWYRAVNEDPAQASRLTLAQIEEYDRDAGDLAWTAKN